MLTMRAASKETGIHPGSILRWIEQREIKPKKVKAPNAAGFYYVFSTADVAKMRQLHRPIKRA